MGKLLAQTKVPFTPDINRGGETFKKACALCHGNNGEGISMMMGPDKPALAPSLTAPNFLALVDDDTFIQTVKQGRPGTGMIARNDVNENDILDILAWLKDKSAKTGMKPSVSGVASKTKTYAGDAAKGKMSYMICQTCHGADGMGYSSKSPLAIAGPAIGAPGYVDLVGEDFIFQSTKHGRPPSLMAPLGLSDEQIGDVIAYLKELGIKNAAPKEAPKTEASH